MQLNARQSTSYKIHLIGAALTAVLLVGCSADEGPSGFTQVPVPVPVPTPPGPAPVITLTATPSSVPAGGTTNIAYMATNATSCVASGAWTGSRDTSGNMTVTVPATAGSYTYTLTCTGASGQQTAQSVTVLVTSTGGGNPGDVTGGDLIPNDGTTPTTVFDGGTQLPGNFICTASARAYGSTPVTAVRVNGLVGSAVTDLLNTLGAGTITQLQNSVTAKELVVDGSLDTAAQYNLSVGLLGGAISSIDLFVGLNSPAPIRKYAVFGVTFPIATAELSLIQSITVRTFNGATVQETQLIDASTLDLVGQIATGGTVRFVGMKVTKPYDGVTISLSPTLISANVGNAMNVHELCTDGFFINAP